MNPQQWEAMKDLFEAALRVPTGERSAFLVASCGEDLVLRAELESLLASYEPDDTADFAVDDRTTPVDDDLAGQRIDRYVIVRRIGSGGMGAVYHAVRDDETFRKHVAIKIVQAPIGAREILSRFHDERRILAALEHPNIARLIDGGTTSAGLPYLVMDYVEGTRLDDYCDRRRLSIAERILLFRGVCAAVQYVHQNLVVHRDLKPANILVTAEGVPKLLDFGIAKLLRSELFANAMDATRAEFRLMTPGYASPEQVKGEPVTTASDVYSLGVVLFELLTGQRPYRLRTDSPIDVLRAVCDQEPERPSTAVIESGNGQIDASQKEVSAERVAERRGTVPRRLQRQLKGDLDTIVLQALQKEPRRRYTSAEQLSEDLRRHLDGLPVHAHPDHWTYRLGKFAYRHRMGVAAVALLILSLTGGVLATSYQARIARAERARAERQFNDVRKLSTSLLFEFHNAIENLPGSTPARRLIVQRALEYLSRLSEQARDDRRLQVELAEAYLKVGDVQGNPYGPNLGDIEGAARSYRTALQISSMLVKNSADDVDGRRYQARSYDALGEVLPQLGNPTEAIGSFRHGTGILESLIAARPDDRGLRAELARAYQALGDLQGHGGLQNVGDPVGALESYRKALSLYRWLVATDGRDKAARRGVALLHIRIGDLQEIRDDLAGGLSAYREALTIAEKLAAEDPANAEDGRRLALAHRKVGGILEDLGDNRTALLEYANATSINERLMNADPTNVQAAMSYAISLRWSGDLLRKTGDTSLALAKYRAVVGILEQLSTTHPANITIRGRHAEILIVTAGLLAEQGEMVEARRMTIRGLASTRELASRPDVTPDDLSQYAQAFLTCEPASLREPSTALRYARASVAKTGETDSVNLDILAQAYFETGDRARAIATEEKAVSLLAPAEANRPPPPLRQTLEAHLAAFKKQ